ncbi:MAG: hypothetical protein H6734_13145 [Alphaproteobacteria bacterium]|nr:hypothetical protein [Alphaproteobacteria bacterium]
MILTAAAWAMVVGPEDDLQALVDAAAGPVVLDLSEGVYTDPIVVDGGTVELRAAPGAIPVLGGEGGPPLLTVRSGGSLRLQGLHLAPTNRGSVRVELGTVEAHGTRFQTFGTGTALTVLDGRAVLDGTRFEGGVGTFGGQVSAHGGVVEVLGAARFVGGEALRGGALWIGPDATLQVGHPTAGAPLAQPTVLSDHRASHGGAVACEGTCRLFDVELSDNRATYAGGAVWAGPGATLELDRADVFRNRAPDGGALYGDGVAAVVRRTTLCANLAVDANGQDGVGGGARLRFDPSVGPSAVEFVRALHNEAGVGGGLFLEGQAAVGYHNLLGNRASSGAALYWEGGDADFLLVGRSRGGPTFAPGSLSFSAYRFLNADDADEYTNDPTRGYAAGEPCGLHTDLYGPGSEFVAGAVGTAGRRWPAEKGAYVTEAGIAAGRVDLDGDGWLALYDCNDSDAETYPRFPADEVFGDGVDQACDGGPDDGFDADQDGYVDSEDCEPDIQTINPGVNDRDPLADLDCDGYSRSEIPELRSADGCKRAEGDQAALWLVPLLALGLGRRRSLCRPD